MPSRKKRNLTAEDLYQFVVVSDVRISPQGRDVVYALQRVAAKDEKKYSNLWIVDAETAKPRQFTDGDQADVHRVGRRTAARSLFFRTARIRQNRPRST